MLGARARDIDELTNESSVFMLAMRSMMPVAREGWPFIAAPLVLAVVLWGVGWHAGTAVAVGLAILTALFFRDPHREIPQGERLILAPADGTVVRVTRYEGNELEGPATQLSIFLSILDVHVNRAPFPSVVEKVDYRPGKFHMAWQHQASSSNEQNLMLLRAAEGCLLVKQIAGFVARRIVCNVVPGQTLKAGERIGMIRFGSRVDLIVPGRVDLVVKPGDRVKGGVSVVGTLR